VPDEYGGFEPLVVDQVQDVFDVRLEIDGGVGEMNALPESGQCDGIDVMSVCA
jgi:hypothetical protein